MAPDAPPLDMPAPPPRDVELTDPEPAAAAATSGEAVRAPAPRRPSSRTDPPKPEAPPDRPEDAPRPPSTLQTAPATAEGEQARAIRATLQRANADLGRVDYRRLNADARGQYDSVKRFIKQAEDAVRAKNLVFASSLAEKAAALAAQLSGR